MLLDFYDHFFSRQLRSSSRMCASGKQVKRGRLAVTVDVMQDIANNRNGAGALNRVNAFVLCLL